MVSITYIRELNNLMLFELDVPKSSQTCKYPQETRHNLQAEYKHHPLTQASKSDRTTKS